MTDDGWPFDGPADPDPWDSEWPNAVNRERWLLGALMHGGEDAVNVAIDAGWQPADCYRAAHEMIGDAIIQMCGTGKAIDPMTLAEWVGGPGHLPARDPMYLFGIWELPVVPGALTDHARQLHELAVKRRLIEGGIRQVQLGRTPGLSAAEAVARADADRERVAGLAIAAVEGENPRAVAADPAVTTRDQVIPGLLLAQDRVIFVAGEGHGKSELLAQLVFCAGCGIHPFLSGIRYDPQPGLIIDLEVGRGHFGRRMGRMLTQADRYGFDDRLVKVWSSPSGLDLRTADGQMTVTALVRKHQPRIMAIGPGYKMGLTEAETSMAEHKRVSDFIDRLRDRYGVTVAMEMHAPMAQGPRRLMRPVMSALWGYWPEFGWGLTAAPKRKGHRWYRLTGFRDPRDNEATWPEFVYWRTGWGWPWAAEYGDGALTATQMHLDDDGGPGDPAAAAEEAAQARRDELAARRARHEQGTP